MKKFLLTLIGIFLFIPCAKALEINQLGLTIDIPEGYNALTRDNTNKENLSFMYKNNLYLETQDSNNQYIYIRAIENPKIQDFSIKNNIMNDVIGLANNINTNDYEYIESDPYKWVRFKYNDKNTDKEVIEYYLAWKKLFLTVTIQAKDKKIDADFKGKTDSIIKSIKLTGEGEAEVSHIYEDGLDKFDYGIDKRITLLIICLIIIGFTYWITRRGKKE